MMTLEIEADFAVSTMIFLWFPLICIVCGNGLDHQSLINMFACIRLVDIRFGSASHSIEGVNVGHLVSSYLKNWSTLASIYTQTCRALNQPRSYGLVNFPQQICCVKQMCVH